MRRLFKPLAGLEHGASLLQKHFRVIQRDANTLQPRKGCLRGRKNRFSALSPPNIQAAHGHGRG